MDQFRSFISQYASNAAERVACHYKERSLLFRIVASRVLSHAPSTPPANSIRPSAHSLNSGQDCALFAWPPRSPDLTPCDFFLWTMFMFRHYPLHWMTLPSGSTQWIAICFNAFGRNSPIALMLSVLMVLVILRGSHTCVLVLLTVREI
jgi:hypothetical protein